ncbi:uncharacterized protein LOC123310793 [Coccinella septempunctata]|uniref:uncharacterized protein LOC123310793 n=1 Tax=Coccinella septempunctata TaxID=41139 RepID=UPI001D06C01D|nr:uncharacterized protein LOC123310793 [Coccinella septempunctata]
MCETTNNLPDNKIWRDFNRKINGKIEKFWIRTLCESEMETALEYLSEYFLKDEPISQALKLYECEDWIIPIREYWRNVLQQKVSLACFKNLDDGNNEMVALSLCRVKSKEDPFLLKNGINEKMKKMFGLFQYVYDVKDFFSEFDVDKVLVGSGLFTMPKYRGFNIGLEMLHARRPLCASLGLKVSITIFTAPASQRLAEKAGFKDYCSFKYEDLGRENPDFEIPDIKSEYIRLMYILY